MFSDSESRRETCLERFKHESGNAAHARCARFQKDVTGCILIHQSHLTFADGLLDVIRQYAGSIHSFEAHAVHEQWRIGKETSKKEN